MSTRSTPIPTIMDSPQPAAVTDAVRAALGTLTADERDVVIRALPPAANATSDELARDLEKALDKAQKKR